ncbi:hypothetical protein WN51_02870 [Melipona quadrifasciata]|uniref:Uncharacterized protein n=1 Tax=Melipona quadrifasciata TaxID=166423 RepID=A0A0N0BJT4_9HYME|nr:hypothetical protein WN51_02870 [Melipona quadrifasciata]
MCLNKTSGSEESKTSGAASKTDSDSISHTQLHNLRVLQNRKSGSNRPIAPNSSLPDGFVNEISTLARKEKQKRPKQSV